MFSKELDRQTRTKEHTSLILYGRGPIHCLSNTSAYGEFHLGLKWGMFTFICWAVLLFQGINSFNDFSSFNASFTVEERIWFGCW